MWGIPGKLACWIFFAFPDNFAVFHYFSRTGKTTYKVGILNFLKAPFASEDSICAEYHFLLLPCYWDLLEDPFSSGFEKNPRDFYDSKYCQATRHLLLWMFGNRSENELVHYREESRQWTKSCPHCYQEEFGFCLHQAPILSSYFLHRKKECIFSLLNNKKFVYHVWS